ncbi:hypothetical protein [Candidatus Neomicrothrix sp.]|jgi:hypothetical protein|uniref:hypothetical protein n=1 Tax=Candidatus Neomicrothrix sp. TaxID=2719034 RepID=UPI001B78A4C5|nr:hypothetical protein [Candidatus Microthrix sp.]MBP7406727.1 hypothetical protein [Candidatus Microthrix sp.]MBP7854162.1 hypothetical protein [Candidatus Microthrix sp.]MBP7879742.1 hypothetical protein [Candidatus Microthrix sp.]MBP8958572.1 hypothetical protein [Candidatus Microthrix sp.]
MKWSSPWTNVRWGDMCADVEADGVSLSLDFCSLRPLLTGATATPAPGPCFMKPDEPTEPTTPTEPTEPTTPTEPPGSNPSEPGSTPGSPLDNPPAVIPGDAGTTPLQPAFTG